MFKSEKNTKSATRPTLDVKPTPKAGQTSKLDPWADKPRLNVLLLGGDADRNRIGTRTDTVILASIDTKTGDTTLFSLPRNTGRMPFPADSPLHKYYPNGFTNGDGNNPEYFLNAMYDNVPNARAQGHPRARPTTSAPTRSSCRSARRSACTVDYYVLINLQGFAKMINALGGITVNINTYIPIGGNTDLGIPPKEYLKPGPNQKLNGREALWYARGRYGSDDFARMDRQRCVINAIIKQANPANMLARYEDIAKAGKHDRLHRHAAGGAAADGRPEPAGEGRQRAQHRVQARRRRLPQPQSGLLADAQAGEGRARRDQVRQAEEEEAQRNRAPPRAKTSTTVARTTRRWRRPRSPIADRRPVVDRGSLGRTIAAVDVEPSAHRRDQGRERRVGRGPRIDHHQVRAGRRLGDHAESRTAQADLVDHRATAPTGSGARGSRQARRSRP